MPAKAAAALTFLLVAVADEAVAQALPSEPSRPIFLPHRFDEDWRPMCDAARRSKPLDGLKCVPIGERATLTFGGELRERLEAADNTGFGLRQDSESVLLHRLLLHGDVRVGETLRGFVQLGVYEQTGRDGRVPPTDVDRVDLAQGFIDLSAPVGGGRATLRGGRQELSFGSSRLVAVREGPNARRSFDGVRAFWTASGRRVDAFAVRPVTITPGTFDNSRDRGEAIWGVYATGAWPALASTGLDLYYLGYERETAQFAGGAATERRHSVGARLFGEASGFDWDVEAAIQFGTFGRADLGAWTVATDTGYTFDRLAWRPRLGFKADVASGDADASDGRLGTFNALYPKLPYFSEANLIAPANLIDVQPSLELALSPTLNAHIGWNGIWRHRRGDAIYTTPLAAVPGTAGLGGRFTGHQMILGVAWQARPELKMAAEYVHFEPGRALEDAGGRKVDFITASAAARF